jgi:hypothetical protein
MTTFQDAIHLLLDYLGTNLSAEAPRDARRAAQNGLRELATAHRWSYFYKQGRIVTVAPQTTGTIAYTHTGATYERQLTLSGATWPSWAKYGALRIGDVTYEVEDRKSSTVLTLTDLTNPGADVAAGTKYTMFRDTYTLPVDFTAADEFRTSTGYYAEYVHPHNWLASRTYPNSSGYPWLYTITGDPAILNRLAARLYPYPDQVYTIDFVYQRQARPLRIDESKDGTVATTNGSTTVTGTGTSWNSTMEGAVIRVNAIAANTATGPVESGPYGFDRSTYYVHERRVVKVNGATSLDVDNALSETLSTAKYVISDPVDVEEGAMLNAFFRACERQVAMIRHTKDKPDAQALYAEALTLAKEADSRSFARRVATGGVGTWGSRRALEIQRPLGADA